MSVNTLKLTPAFKEYIWGGTKLKTLYNKECDLDTVAESWELSAHKDGESVICGGEYDGLTLNQYIAQKGKDVLGSNAKRFDYFPVLIKFIDACNNLSVQVHPDDDYALKNEGEYGKTEMWYVLDCEPDAYLYYGFKRDITKSEYQSAIENNTLTELLNKVHVKKGDVFFIPAGTVHAIGAGIVICEIQQNSNTTYRVYDYNRRDKDGNTRPLHIEKALEVSTLDATVIPERTPDSKDVLLAKSEYFTVRKLSIDKELKIDIDSTSFHSLTVLCGEGTVEGLSVRKGDSIFIPATDGSYTVSGNLEVILTKI